MDSKHTVNVRAACSTGGPVSKKDNNKTRSKPLEKLSLRRADFKVYAE